MKIGTADICDEHGDSAQVADPVFRSFGGLSQCCGQIATIRIDEDNSDLIASLNEPGQGRFLAVDAGGAYCAVVGDRLAALAHKNGWAGLVINGYVRDISEISAMPIGIWALGACPRRSTRKARGQRGVELEFAGVRFVPGHFLYADQDGVVVTARAVDAGKDQPLRSTTG
jgi:regulator of ribonuclease activity A